MNTTAGVMHLKDKGHRISRGRRAILQVFEEARMPITAVDVLSELSRSGTHVNKTTVYRELTFLVGEGLLREVPVSSSSVYYESALQDHHHHLICNSCHTITEVDTGILEKNVEVFARTIQKKQGFTIQHHALEFFGTCASCQTL